MLIETDIEGDTAPVSEAEVLVVEVRSSEESELSITVDPSPVTGPALLLSRVLASPVVGADEFVSGNEVVSLAAIEVLAVVGIEVSEPVAGMGLLGPVDPEAGSDEVEKG